MINLTMEEREYIRIRGFKPPMGVKPGPWKYRVSVNDESLEIARRVIELSEGYEPGLVESAQAQVAEELGCSVSTVKTHVRRAKLHAKGGWWGTRVSMTHNKKARKPF
jgi:hypothetical protein